jgi:hypothetical protein
MYIGTAVREPTCMYGRVVTIMMGLNAQGLSVMETQFITTVLPIDPLLASHTSNRPSSHDGPDT